MGWNTDINEVETFTDPAAEGWVLYMLEYLRLNFDLVPKK